MPADAAGDVLGGIVRFLGRIFVEFVFEVLVRGTGYLLVRPFRGDADIGDDSCAVVGVLAWIGIAVGGYALYRHLAG